MYDIIGRGVLIIGTVFSCVYSYLEWSWQLNQWSTPGGGHGGGYISRADVGTDQRGAGRSRSRSRTEENTTIPTTQGYPTEEQDEVGGTRAPGPGR